MIRTVLASLLTLCACTRNFKTPADTLLVAIGAQPATLDPRFATDANGMNLSGLVFESLVHVGDGFLPAPEAAESWSYKDKVYSFYLRPNMTFHNGRPVTPEDILYSFAYFRSDKGPFGSTLDIIKDVTAHQEGERIRVDIRLLNASEKFLISDLPSIKILPQKEIEQLGPDFTQTLIGSGPYRFLKQDLNEIRFASVRAKTPFLTFKVVRDDFTRYQKLLKGEVDLAQAEIPAERVADFERRPQDFQVLRFPGLTMAYILVNFRDPILKQRAVRQALARTLKRDEIIRFKLSGLASEATSILTPSNPYFNLELKNPSTNLAAAKQTIRELGLQGHRLVLKTSNSPQAIDNGKVLVNQLSQSGLDVDLESYEWATFYGDIKKGNFQLATMKWVGTVDPDIYRLAFASKELPPGRNRGAYLNPTLDALMERATNEANVKLRRQIFMQVQKTVHEDLAIIPLWYDEQVVIARKNVLDYKPALNSDFLPLVNVRKREL